MFDKTKLAALRAKYEDTKETEVAPERFRAPLADIFGSAYRRPMPYAGIPTLLDAPYRPDAAGLPDFAGLDVALIGVPMDLGVTNRPGARFGPRAVRDIERIGPYNHALEIMPRMLCNAADIGDVPMRSRYSLDQSIEDIALFYDRVREAGVRPVSVGGDHSITFPILKALGQERPLGLVHIDAHCDTMGAVDGSKFHHGGPFRQAVLAGALDPERTIQIGIRGPAEIFWGFSYDFGDDGVAHRGCRPTRHRRGHRAGEGGRRRRADLHFVRCRRARPGLYAGNRHARSRRAVAARGPGDPARPQGSRHHRRRCR